MLFVCSSNVRNSASNVRTPVPNVRTPVPNVRSCCSSYQSYPPREQVVHHALLELAGFGELGFEGGDFGVHVGEDGGDGGLFGNWRNSEIQFRKIFF